MPNRSLFLITLMGVALVGSLLPLHRAHAHAPIWQLDANIVALLSTPVVTSAAPGLLLPMKDPAQAVTTTLSDPADEIAQESTPRQILTGLADTLLNIRYRRGGRTPATGFDCSGFVHYVFRHALGAELPASSAAQFQVGDKINRDEMQRGDLVFFRTAGKRISHVGIYLQDGQFIHAPSSGKTVRVDRLDHGYWKQRFAGAKRPQALARHDAANAAHAG